MNMVFIDASAWIALFHMRDKYHKTAWLAYEQLLNEAGKFLTSNWVTYEAISILKSRTNYRTAKTLWDILQDTDLSESSDVECLKSQIALRPNRKAPNA